MVQVNFSLQQTEVAQDFGDPVPTDWYSAIVTNTELRMNKDGFGSKVVFTFKIIEGEFANKPITVFINWENRNDQCVQIGRGKIKSIANALGFQDIQDTAQLHNQPFKAKFVYVDKTETYGAHNEFKVAKPYGAQSGSVQPNVPPAQAPAQTQPMTQAPVGQDGWPVQNRQPQQTTQNDGQPQFNNQLVQQGGGWQQQTTPMGTEQPVQQNVQQPLQENANFNQQELNEAANFQQPHQQQETNVGQPIQGGMSSPINQQPTAQPQGAQPPWAKQNQ